MITACNQSLLLTECCSLEVSACWNKKVWRYQREIIRRRTDNTMTKKKKDKRTNNDLQTKHINHHPGWCLLYTFRSQGHILRGDPISYFHYPWYTPWLCLRGIHSQPQINWLIIAWSQAISDSAILRMRAILTIYRKHYVEIREALLVQPGQQCLTATWKV